MPNTEKRRKFIINFAYALVWVVIVYVAIKYLLGILMPFILGFAVAALLRTPVRKIARKYSINLKFASIFSVIIFYSTVGVLISLLVVRLFVWIGGAVENLPEFYNNTLSPYLSDFFDFAEDIFEKFDNSAMLEYGSLFSNAELSLGSAITSFSVRVVEYISGIVGNLPMFLLEVILCIVSTFFFAADYEYITGFLIGVLPKALGERLLETKKCLSAVLLKYFKSYSFILLITFGELSLGLTLAGVKNSFIIALIIALLDIMPILGTGAVLIPWAVIKFIQKDIGLGAALLIIYAAITVIRNIIEPRIVGKEVGLHPTLTLISMFVGIRLFGGIGLFLLPIGLSVWKSLEDCSRDSSLHPKSV